MKKMKWHEKNKIKQQANRTLKQLTFESIMMCLIQKMHFLSSVYT